MASIFKVEEEYKKLQCVAPQQMVVFIYLYLIQTKDIFETINSVTMANSQLKSCMTKREHLISVKTGYLVRNRTKLNTKNKQEMKITHNNNKNDDNNNALY
jgi:hypothetical protein